MRKGEYDTCLLYTSQIPQVRDELLKKINRRVEEICRRRGTEWVLNILSKDMEEKPCDPQVQQIIEKACEKSGYPVYKMPSGAGHDSGAFIPFCPSGMIFIRSKDGLSHNGADVYKRQVLWIMNW